MINECYSLLRKKQREIPVERLPETAEEVSPDALILRDALERLPPAQRLPLILHYFEGFSIREVAGILRLPQGTVLSRMQRGREKLKELLSEENDGQ
ncbi:MAG: RNA polymerase sigma factor [Christensenellales bacterium]